jgi:putative aldouronate transport system substrate-binding protein
MINTHWLDVLGLEMPKTIDDFYQVLKAFKTQDPNGNGKADEIPLCVSFAERTHTFWRLLGWFGITADRDRRVYAEDDGMIVYVPTDERTLEALKWFNKLWNEGLLDEESFTHKWREIDAKGQAEEAELLGAFMRSTIAWTVGFDRFDHYEIMPALENHLGTRMVTGTNVQSKGRFSLTNKVKNPEAIIRWIDYFATVEGALNIQFGPEGENWEWADDAKSQWTRIKKDTQSTAEATTPKNGTHVPFINFDWITRNRALAEDEIDWQAKVYAGIDEHLHPYRRVPFPDAYMSIDQVNAVSALQTDLNAYVDQMFARFIVGDEPFDNWDTYVETVNRMGVERLLAVYQDVYDSYNK